MPGELRGFSCDVLYENKFNKEFVLIPAFTVEIRSDKNLTGLGDIFLAGTLIYYLLSKNVKKSLIFGSLLAKIHLEENLDLKWSKDSDKIEDIYQIILKVPKEYYRTIKLLNSRQINNLLWKK